MKRISLASFASLIAAGLLLGAPSAGSAAPGVQSGVDVYENCIEQAILVQLRVDPANRSADAVRAACASHRAALDSLLGAGARSAVDEALSRRIAEALSPPAYSSPAP